MKVAQWQAFIFVSLDPNAPELIDWLESHYSRPRQLEKFDMASLKNARTTVDEVQANWKVLGENYSECLHCAVVHPELVDLVPIYKTGSTTQTDRPDWGVSLAEVQLRCLINKMKTCHSCRRWTKLTTIPFLVPMFIRTC